MRPDRRAPSLRAHLVALVLAVLVPSLGLGAATAWHLAENYRRAFEERLAGTARALATAADAEIGAVVTAAETLAASPLLDAPAGLAAFDAQARRVGAALDSWVVVTRASDMQQLVNTRLPPGEPLPGAFGPSAVSAALHERAPVVRDLTTVPFRREPIVAVLTPVVRGGERPPAAVVVVPLIPARLARLLEAQGVSADAFATLVDGRGSVVARSSEHARFLGRPVPGWYAPATAGRARGLLRGPAIEGREMVFAFERLRTAPGWTVVVAEPMDAYRAAWRDPLLGLVAGATAAFAFGIGLAGWLARRILRPVSALVDRAEASANKRDRTARAAPPLPPAGVAEFEVLRAASERAEAALRASEAEFRAAFEQSALAMVQSDYATGRYVRVNAAFCRLAGRPESDLLGRHFAELVHPDDLDAQRAAIRSVARGEAASYEVVKRLILPDGGVRWVRVSSAPGRDSTGRLVRTVAILQDITEGRAAAAALRASEERLRLAQDAGGIGAWEVDVATGARLWSESTYRLWGLEPRESVTLDVIMALIHPADRARVQAAVSAVAAMTGPLPELEFRIVRRADGATRWLLSRGESIADERGRPARLLGVMRDVTAGKEAVERLVLLARELDHRAKNALAVVQAALRLTPKDDAAAYAEAVEGRVAALARAHTLLAEGRWQGAGLRALLEAELAPFLPVCPDAAVAPLRATFDGPPLTLAPGAAQALSMALHELATNATKHGALSVREGQVAVSWDIDRRAGRLRLRWAEIGGPPTAGPPPRRGFGSRVLEATVRDQLGGKVERRWELTGLVCDIEAPLGRTVAGGELAVAG